MGRRILGLCVLAWLLLAALGCSAPAAERTTGDETTETPEPTSTATATPIAH